MDLFEYVKEKNLEKESPLASPDAPGHPGGGGGPAAHHRAGKLLYRAVKADKLSSLIFYGPPGTGKTTLAQVIAHSTSAEFTRLNATLAGKKDMRRW